MAASAGTVTLDLDANSVKLLRELQKAERSTKKSAGNMGADFSRMASNIAKTTAVVATAFAAMATKLTRDGLKVIDANAKMARSLNASNDALMALQMAAGDAGLEGLEGSLGRMTRALGAAELGTGRAVKTIEVLGLDLAALSQMDVDQKLQTIAEAIQKAGISSEQTSRHLQNLGFDQAQAMQFFSSGITDLTNYRKEINALGLSLSSFDAARVERANDAMGVFGDVVQGISQRVAVNMSDILYYFSEAFTQMAVESGNLGTIVDDMFQKILMGSIDIFEAIGTALSPIFSIIKSLWESFMALPQFARELGIVGALLFGRAGLAGVIAITAAIKALQSAVGFAANQVAMTGSETFEESTLNRLRGLLAGEADFSPMEEVAGLFTPNYENNVAAQASRLRQIMQNVADSRENLRVQMSLDPMWNDPSINDLMDGPDQFVGPPQPFVGPPKPFVGPMLEKDFVAVKEFTEKADSQLNQFAQQAANNMQSAFANFLFDPFKEGLRGMLSGLIDTLRRMVAEIAAQKILGAIFGGLANAPNAFISSLGRSFGGTTNIVGPQLPTMDKGGRGVAGQPYMIGRGAQPEVFIPDSAGTFIPNADQMGGTTFNITVDARDAGAEARIRDMINQEMAPQIIAAAKGSTMAAMRRPRFA
jgi:hypothetical protein